MKGAEIITMLEQWAPRELAYDWDPVGIQAGDPGRQVKHVMVALDANLCSVQAAQKAGAQMLVTHHPAFFEGFKQLDERSPHGALAAAIARARLLVYSAHTNLDITSGGVNDCMARLLGLRETLPLAPTGLRHPLEKLVIFVPQTHLEKVRNAVCSAGAGIIGEYDHCAYRVDGIGCFRPSAKANPHIGKAGKLEEVKEYRLETLLQPGSRMRVLEALRQAHPYEEPAFDLYPVDDGKPRGCGRVGVLEKGITLDELAKLAKRSFKAPCALVWGDGKRKVKRVAVWSGGGAPVMAAANAGAEAMVAGEFKHNDTNLATHEKLGLIALGHGPSEAVILPEMAKRLKAGFKGLKVTVLMGGHGVFRPL